MSQMPRILCVDDEANILSAIQRSLRKKFEIVTASSGREGLEILANQPPFSVVISDMKMPEMNGATFLKMVYQGWPDTVRVLLTGFAEMDTVVKAINEGHIYRFIAKPVSAATLAEVVGDAVRQHELISSERVLLEETLKGSVQALVEVLSLSNPAVFGRGTRIAQTATLLARRLKVKDLWQIEVAALFSQIGTISLPQATAMRWYSGDKLSDAEKAMVDRMPAVRQSILAPIPRLEPVLEILSFLDYDFQETGKKGEVAGEDIPLGSRILRVATRCDELVTRGATPGNILDDLRANAQKYDPAVVKAYEAVGTAGKVQETIRGVTLQELRTGMIFTEPVKAKTGVLLVGAGQECSVSLLERIHNYASTVGVELPMWVQNPELLEEEEEEEVKVEESPAEPVGNGAV